MQAKKWNGFVLLSIMVLFVMIALPTIYYDPYFHYHAPWVPYKLNNERYQNDGIVKHFTYDALITGTSMVENFKTSEFDALFGVNSIKVPFSGGSFKEVNNCVMTAVKNNPDLKIVLRGLDLNKLDTDKEYMGYRSYPTYLYNDMILDDAEYVLNKEIFLENILWSVYNNLVDGESETFDDYAYWAHNTEISYGKEAIMASYKRQETKETRVELTQDDQERILANIEQNVLKIARDNPQITFYYFLTPYSVVWWDEMDRLGKVNYTVKTQEIVIESLLTCDNIKLYSWCEDVSLINDLDYYKDKLHYSANINAEMLSWMLEGKGLLTTENYKEYIDKIREYYGNYDYDALFAS